jgi:ParB family chromosome partitioning protein
MTHPGHLILEHAIGQITAGHVYRHDLGDLSDLIDSIQRLGLLTPISITTGNVLISGKRRLAALRELGYRTAPVWVVTGVSDKLSEVLAIQDENILHKMLTPIEQAELYAELKELLAEANARKQKATRFGASPTDTEPEENPVDGAATDGGVDSTPPSALSTAGGKTRIQAAKAVTGKDSHSMLDHVVELQQIAASEDEQPDVRQEAAEALIELNADGKVNGRYQRVKLLQAVTALTRAAEDPNQTEEVRTAAVEELRTLQTQAAAKDTLQEAARALAHLEQLRHQEVATGPRGWVDADPLLRQKHQIRKLVDLLRREHGWWDRYDPTDFGRYADAEQWQLVESYATGTAEFLTIARQARRDTSTGDPA